MPPRTTLWPIEPHTLGKHRVLKNYLDAWFPIMGRFNGRILFIDGFAGPGEYAQGEEGSPLIALHAFKDHRAKGEISAEVSFLFIEKDNARAQHLDDVLNRPEWAMPPNCRTQVVPGVFDGTMTQVLDNLDAQARHLAPSFVMVDPFGVSDTPMSVMGRILRNPKSEVYISFMYEFIDRFRETPEFEIHLDGLFGTPNWRDGMGMADSELRKQFFYDLYEHQLRNAGAKQVVHFELYEGQRLIYAIFFGTQHPTGCDRMKQAIWRIAPFGDFAFRASRSGQLTMSLYNPNYDLLKRALREHFCDRGWVGIQKVSEFVASDSTDFHTGQLKRSALAPMEDSEEIEVKESSRRRKRTYPDGTVLRFR